MCDSIDCEEFILANRTEMMRATGGSMGDSSSWLIDLLGRPKVNTSAEALTVA